MPSTAGRKLRVPPTAGGGEAVDGVAGTATSLPGAQKFAEKWVVRTR
jgi:hypothetical protein